MQIVNEESAYSVFVTIVLRGDRTNPKRILELVKTLHLALHCRGLDNNSGRGVSIRHTHILILF
jgi:hypothetical protein